MNNQEVNQLIEIFQLEPHPEGGFYKETYRSEGSYDSLPSPFSGKRNFSTAIYFLLPHGQKSTFHKIAADEIWHFYLGEPMSLYQISPDGKLEIITLGRDISKGQKLQHVVPAGYWFGGHPNDTSNFSFVGCTVSPGFDFSDFIIGDKNELIELFPQHQMVIEKLVSS